MEAVQLDPAGYDGTYKLVGGRLAFDLVNTISWPETPRCHDWLTTPRNVAAWLTAVGIEAEVQICDADIATIRELRTTISDAVTPLARGETPAPRAVERLNPHIAAVAAARRIDPNTLTWESSPPLTAIDLFRPVVDDAADIVTSGIRARLKCCPSCDWVFEDQTRNGRRRWCDMADCGSRAKSRTYYHRTRRSQH